MTDQNVDIRHKTSNPSCIGCFFVVVTFAGSLFFYLYFDFEPRGRVRLSFLNTPDDVGFLCVAVKSADKLECMHWSQGGIMRPSGGHPKDAGWFFGIPREGQKGQPLSWAVLWKWGEQYGVVQKRKDKSWWLTWFNADEVPVQNRSWFFGQGEVEFDLAKGRTEPLIQEKVQELGLENMRFNGN